MSLARALIGGARTSTALTGRHNCQNSGMRLMSTIRLPVTTLRTTSMEYLGTDEGSVISHDEAEDEVGSSTGSRRVKEVGD